MNLQIRRCYGIRNISEGGAYTSDPRFYADVVSSRRLGATLYGSKGWRIAALLLPPRAYVHLSQTT